MVDALYIEKIIGGDEKAFEYLINKYKDMSYTIAYRILRHEEEAEECTQDAFIKVYRSLPSFKQGALFSTWLYKIVYNTALSRLKSLKGYNERFVQTDDEVMSIEEEKNLALATHDQKKYIQLGLARLDEPSSLILTLYYLSELTVEEIEQVTSWSVSNIKIRLFRARKKLSAELKNILRAETIELL